MPILICQHKLDVGLPEFGGIELTEAFLIGPQERRITRKRFAIRPANFAASSDSDGRSRTQQRGSANAEGRSVSESDNSRGRESFFSW